MINSSTSGSHVILDGVSFAFPHSGIVLNGISLSIAKGEFISVIGRSGCGKSTLLSLLAGLLRPNQGTISIAGNALGGCRQETAVILQHYGLLPWKTVHENVALGLKLREVNRVESDRLIAQILERVGMTHKAQHYLRGLSGGERQRTAIARALVLKPDLLLLDEPFSAVDALTREALQQLLVELWQELRFTAVLVTHSIEEACYLGQRTVVLGEAPGRVVATLEQPQAASASWRESMAYLCRCTELRGLLQ